MTGARATSITPGDFTILVVDDVDDNRDLMARRLRRNGFVVVVAADGQAALNALESNPIDLIILDVTMPGMSGLEVLQAVRTHESWAAMPVIMATARSESEHVVEALDLGADDYVTKPIDFPVLHARVIAALRTKARPGPALAEVAPGAIVAGRYQLVEKIGEGGFGVVYRAMHTELKHSVAVKVLHRAYTSGDLLDRFRLEGMHACRVQHPNALNVLDSGVTEDGIAYLAMELLEGHSLEEEMITGPTPYVRCAEILAPVCEALAAAHAAGIVHRDIKPGNIYLHRGPLGEIPKVLDFGIAKLVGDAAIEQRMTIEGSLIGTPAFMSPERFQNKPYDGKSDVYAIGVLLNQMICGALPFASISSQAQIEPMALALMHTQEPPIPLRSRETTVPEGLENLVLRALAKDPAERPTAADMAQKLVGAVEGVAPDAVAAYRPPVSLQFDTAPTEGHTLSEAITNVSRQPTVSIKKPEGGSGE